MKYAAAYSLREAGYAESLVQRVMAIREQIDEYFRGAHGPSTMREPYTKPRVRSPGSSWRAARTNPPSQIDGSCRWTSTSVRRSVASGVRSCFSVGEWDRWVPIETTVETWRSALGPTADLTVARIPGRGTSSDGGCESRRPD